MVSKLESIPLNEFHHLFTTLTQGQVEWVIERESLFYIHSSDNSE